MVSQKALASTNGATVIHMLVFLRKVSRMAKESGGKR